MASRLASRGARSSCPALHLSLARPALAANATSASCNALASRTTRSYLNATNKDRKVKTDRAGPSGNGENLYTMSTNPVYRKAHHAFDRFSLPYNDFANRHNGPRGDDVKNMLATLDPAPADIDEFVRQVIPKDVISPPETTIRRNKKSEQDIEAEFGRLFRKNKMLTFMNGGGFYPVQTPNVIVRNILENPGWYTSYTPYQPEISQGRLESLLNFQTMVCDLTGLPVANASLLDEASAASEAMTMSLNCLSTARAKRPNKTFVVSRVVHRSSFKVMQGRAEGFGINLLELDLREESGIQRIKDLGDDLVGVMVQYPDSAGGVRDYSALADVVHEQGALLSCATDLSALTILKPPGEWGADIAFGNSQRFGIPLGYGGPHAAFMAVKDSIKRRLPGRLVGVSKDRRGRPALRLALQTREQHIRREKATSNVCTSQALLANMAAMYAVYHGPKELKMKALENLRYARMLQQAAEVYGLKCTNDMPTAQNLVLSDTVTVHMPSLAIRKAFAEVLLAQAIDVGGPMESEWVRLAIPGDFRWAVFFRIVKAFQEAATTAPREDVLDTAARIWETGHAQDLDSVFETIPDSVRRTSPYLTHPVFNSHHSETEMMRYIHHLQSKDLSLVHSMIPLGSCTMKLNAAVQMKLITHPKNGGIHPLTHGSIDGLKELQSELMGSLCAITGMNNGSLQPNSGAQGEYAGLRAIRKYLEQTDNKRHICLIPASAHGTNPASAAMAGMTVKVIKCDPVTGNLDLEDLESKCKQYADELGCIMITYPSTFGVFEPEVKKVCDMVHEYGGQVYMDGANMNAQIGITSPGAIGADVCHLNLHKTFCIPHGGGGPGVGPICVKSHLAPYLPHVSGASPVTATRFGSSSILPISWAYIGLMADEGLRKATEMALLSANYMLTRLKGHYQILHTNAEGRCAHEFIIDARPFKETAGIEAIDIAKRLQDYGFHAPTMSWPVANTLMIEPTESESKEEMDRFIDAMISIREEIREVEEGKQPKQGNVLKNAPHPQIDLIMGDGEGAWERPYSREKAAYPLPYLMEKKFWPSVARIDDAYGDTNLFCTCPPVEDTPDE